MKRVAIILSALAAVATLGYMIVGTRAAHAQPAVARVDMEYFKRIHETSSAPDPQATMFLASHFRSSAQSRAGMDYFARLSMKAGLAPGTKALFLAAQGLLRASVAPEVSLFSRTSWVRDAIALLEEAKRLSKEESFMVRWTAGVVFAQLPRSFGRREAAREELEWCRKNISRAPHAGWLREVYRGLARAGAPDGEALLTKSGFKSIDEPSLLTTPYSMSLETGFTFAPPEVEEIVRGKVVKVTGIDFADLFFIRSEDGKQVISIDAGTTAATVQTAWEQVRKVVGDWPAPSSVLVTHAHWDHIGGHEVFRRLNPPVRFYGRENWRDEIDAMSAREPDSRFFGKGFSKESVARYRPDVVVSKRTSLTIGGTKLELIPVSGGETADALLVHMPDPGLVFAGDIMMPYIGAPSVEEGSPEGYLEGIKAILDLEPTRILHGHGPLTRMFGSEVLKAMQEPLRWLQAETVKAIAAGRSREEIHHLNLIAQQVAQNPALQIPYFLIRENLINRIFDLRTGYWEPNLNGMDHVSDGELQQIFSRYLGLSDEKLRQVIARMLREGDQDLAGRMVRIAGSVDRSAEFAELRRRVYTALRDRFQETDPFKFIIYSGEAKESVRAEGIARP